MIRIAPRPHSSQTTLLINTYLGKKEINKAWKTKDQSTLPEKRRYRLADAVWEPLIDEQTFNQVQLLLKKNYNSKHNAALAIKHTYLLNSGKLWCDVCGSEMEGGSGTGRFQKKYYYYLCKKTQCKFRVPADEIETFIIGYIKELATKKEDLKLIIQATNGQLHKELPQLVTQKSCLQKELTQVQNLAQGILEKWSSLATDDNALFIKDKLDELGKRRKDIENGISTLEIMIGEIERESVNQEMMQLMLTKFSEIFDSMRPYQQKELINILLHKACLSQSEIKIALHGKQTDTRLFDIGTPQGEIRPGISEWLPREGSNLGQAR